MNRRAVLATVGAGVNATALAGCTQLSGVFPGCDDMHSTVVDVAPASLSDEQLSNLAPLAYAELPPEHREIVEQASGDGEYRTCPDQSDPVVSFVDRAEERLSRQWQNYDGDSRNHPEYLRSAYLERDGSYLELEIIVEDQFISG